MALSLSLYNSTATAIVIDDVPVTATIPAHGNVTMDASTTLSDVQSSLLLRHYDLSGQVAVTLNGRGVRLSKLALLVGAGASGGGGSPDVNPTPNTEVLRNGSAEANVKGVNVFDPVVPGSSGDVRYDDAQGALTTGASFHAAGVIWSDNDMYVGGSGYVDPAVTLLVPPPAIAAGKWNVRQSTNRKAIIIYDDGDGITRGELWLGTDNQGDPVPGWGSIRAMIGGAVSPLLLTGAPIKLSGAVEQNGSMYNFPHVLEADPSPYTVLATDQYIVVAQTAPGAFQILLPPAGAGRRLTIKDGLGDAAINNITITADGADLIDGASHQTIDLGYASVEIIAAFIDSTWTWLII